MFFFLTSLLFYKATITFLIHQVIPSWLQRHLSFFFPAQSVLFGVSHRFPLLLLNPGWVFFLSLLCWSAAGWMWTPVSFLLPLKKPLHPHLIWFLCKSKIFSDVISSFQLSSNCIPSQGSSWLKYSSKQLTGRHLQSCKQRPEASRVTIKL